mmetsp:Transcript_5769/g.19381  ORF Transcript_5769/g.19381 Transcript_5769/m.19381 type:complete len:200 (+) Transcript_5769:290-889(+)
MERLAPGGRHMKITYEDGVEALAYATRTVTPGIDELFCPGRVRPLERGLREVAPVEVGHVADVVDRLDDQERLGAAARRPRRLGPALDVPPRFARVVEAFRVLGEAVDFVGQSEYVGGISHLPGQHVQHPQALREDNGIERGPGRDVAYVPQVPVGVLPHVLLGEEVRHGKVPAAEEVAEVALLAVTHAAAAPTVGPTR